MNALKKSVIAGSWYPGNPSILRRDIENYFNSVPYLELGGEVVGLIAPHAGYTYSGQVAASAYNLVRGEKYDVVIVVAPSHRIAFHGVSIFSTGGYETPLGIVPVAEELAEKIKILRNHGISYQDGRIDFVSAGFNYRMTNFQAAMGRVQLRKFIDNYPKRIGQAQEYLHILEPYSDLISLPNNSEGHSWQTFMIILPEDVNRSEVINKLKLLGIETNLGAQALHMLTYFKDKYGINENSLPRARKAFLHGLALPMGNHLKEEDISIICKHLINLIKL